MKLLCSIKSLHCLSKFPITYTNETLNTKYILVFIERNNICNLMLLILIILNLMLCNVLLYSIFYIMNSHIINSFNAIRVKSLLMKIKMYDLNKQGKRKAFG